MPRVIVLDNLSQDGLNVLESSSAIDYEVQTGLEGDELRRVLRDFDGAICRSGVKITSEVLEGNRRLKVIARAGVGTDNIDKAAATRRGIVVMNTPGGNTVSTAEHTITLMLAVSRHVHPAYQGLIEGRWDRKQYMGVQVSGKTLGIIGLGRIGQAVAARALAMEMRVLGYDPFLPQSRVRQLGLTHCSSLEDLLPEADYLTVHTPLNDSTRHLIGADAIRKMKAGVRIINCARGGILDSDAIVQGLERGHLGGVAIDVYEDEPCTENPLFGMPNVVCTPHLGASTREAQSSVAVEAAQLLIDFFATGEVKSSVNMAPLDPVTLSQLQGYLNVAYRLGLLVAQVSDRPPSSCRLHYHGEVAQNDCRPLSAAFAAGLLEHAMDLEVNLVNAELLLRERGVTVVEQLSRDAGDYRSTIMAEIDNDQTGVTVGGTLLGDRIPGLVRLGHSQLECRLEGNLLVTTHSDSPGVIGKLGHVCGKHHVNIAYLSIGRGPGESTGTQIGMLKLDDDPPAAAIDELLALEPVFRATVVHLPPADVLPPWMKG